MQALTVQQAFTLALSHHRCGRLGEAEAIFRQILAQQPNHFDALQFLGIIASQVGQHQAAVELLQRATALAPNAAVMHSNLGEAYRRSGRHDEAITACRRAIELKPDIEEVYNTLGNALSQQGRLEEATSVYRRALEFQPLNADFSSNLGIVLSELGLIDESIAAYRRALQIAPDCPPILNNFAGSLCMQGRLDEAIATFRRVLDIQPDYTDALNNLAGALIDSRQLDEGAATCRRALQIEPGSAQVHGNLGNVLKDQGLLDEAMKHYRRASELLPDSPQQHSNLVYAAHFHPDYDSRVLQVEGQRWNERHAVAAHLIQPHGNSPDPARRLKVGYVSPDFRDHVIGRNLVPLLANHDDREFEIICYSGTLKPDAITERFRSMAHGWRTTIGIGDARLAAMIRDDGIDILVDLAQHMSGNRLPVFARKPAPVQVSFAGYPGSTGLVAIEHRISDWHLDPEPASNSEQVWRIDSFWCYDPCGADVTVNALPSQETGALTFGCLANFCKINERVLALWARVLNEIPDSRLLILSPAGSHRERVAKWLESRGVREERVEFVAFQPRREYLEQYHRIDVVLDTFPYNGHTTSLDALWMGVPVVTLCGDTPVSRAGLSILTNVELPELIARSNDEYVRHAVKLAQDRPRLAQLRSSLRERMKASVLTDAPHFARQIEQAYRAMWQTWCAGR